MADPAATATTTQPNEQQPAEPATDLALFCPSCFYDLRGSTAHACPECGATLNRDQLAESMIPWVHREGMGLRAMLRTAWLATFKTRLFCLEIARPMSL